VMLCQKRRRVTPEFERSTGSTATPSGKEFLAVLGHPQFGASTTICENEHSGSTQDWKERSAAGNSEVMRGRGVGNTVHESEKTMPKTGREFQHKSPGIGFVVLGGDARFSRSFERTTSGRTGRDCGRIQINHPPPLQPNFRSAETKFRPTGSAA